MTHNSTEASGGLTSGRSIGTIGTVARLAGAGALIFLAVGAGDGVQWWDAALGLAVFPGAVLAAQIFRLRYTRDQLQATSGLGFCLSTGVAAVLLSVNATQDAALLFFGSSLVLAALRGYAGCEVLAISNFLLRRDDQIGCMVYSPIDEIEARVTTTVRA
jgi:hypothetical protein